MKKTRVLEINALYAVLIYFISKTVKYILFNNQTFLQGEKGQLS